MFDPRTMHLRLTALPGKSFRLKLPTEAEADQDRIDGQLAYFGAGRLELEIAAYGHLLLTTVFAHRRVESGLQGPSPAVVLQVQASTSATLKSTPEKRVQLMPAPR